MYKLSNGQDLLDTAVILAILLILKCFAKGVQLSHKVVDLLSLRILGISASTFIYVTFEPVEALVPLVSAFVSHVIFEFLNIVLIHFQFL